MDVEPSFFKRMERPARACKAPEDAIAKLDAIKAMYAEITRALSEGQTPAAVSTVGMLIPTWSALVNDFAAFTMARGVDFFDDVFVEQLWLPAAGLATDDPLLATLLHLLSKVDHDAMDLPLKRLLLPALVHAMLAPCASLSTRDLALQATFLVLYGDDHHDMQSGSTRRAATKLALGAGLPAATLQMITDPPEAGPGPEAAKRLAEMREDCAYLLCMLLSTLVGEMKAELAGRYAPAILKEVDQRSPELWRQLGRMSDGAELSALGEAPYSLLVLLTLCALDPAMRKLCMDSDGKEIANAMVARLKGMPACEALGYASSMILEGRMAPTVLCGLFKGQAEMLATHLGPLYANQAMRSMRSSGAAGGGDDPGQEEQQQRGLGEGSTHDYGTLCLECGRAETPELKLMRCSACRSAQYCSRLCQKRHWAQHKAECKRLLQEAASAEPAAAEAAGDSQEAASTEADSGIPEEATAAAQ